MAAKVKGFWERPKKKKKKIRPMQFGGDFHPRKLRLP
jgi:hypothetical protein